jgi:pimeloyl-ACP methyl ester carboxylesterase
MRVSLLPLVLAAAIAAGGPVIAQTAPAAAPAASPDSYPRPAPDTRPLQYGRFTVEVVGKGPDVILIPGLNSGRDTFKALVQAEKGRYRFHLIQLAGFAGTPAGDNATGEVVAPTVEAIDGYIRDHKLKAPAVIGHSLGGEAALMLAARHPGDVGKVMAVDSLPFLGALFGQSAPNDQLKGMADQIAAGMAGSDDAGWQKGAIANTAPLIGEGPNRDLAIGWGLASDRRVSAQAFKDLILTDLRPELPKITVPATILYAYGPQMRGQTTAQVDGFVGGLYAGLKGGKLIRVDDSHHFIMFDQPARFQAEVEAFLKP